MQEQQMVNRARTFGFVIAIALVLVALAWRFLLH
jgi:hypothetical protein